MSVYAISNKKNFETLRVVLYSKSDSACTLEEFKIKNSVYFYLQSEITNKKLKKNGNFNLLNLNSIVLLK